MRPPILITGCARSMTSMTAGIVELCGAFGGITSPANRNNTKGMFENTYIRQEITKPYLRSLGCDILGQDPLPSDEQVQNVSVSAVRRIRSSVVGRMKTEGLRPDQPWYYKGAKMCLVWQAWSLAFPRAKWIVVRRDTEDIVRSCLHTGFMKAFRDADGWRGWVATHEKRFAEMRDAGLDLREVWPIRMINGDFSEMKEVVGWCGLEWDDEKVRGFVDPALCHYRRGS